MQVTSLCHARDLINNNNINNKKSQNIYMEGTLEKFTLITNLLNEVGFSVPIIMGMP